MNPSTEQAIKRFRDKFGLGGTRMEIGLIDEFEAFLVEELEKVAREVRLEGARQAREEVIEEIKKQVNKLPEWVELLGKGVTREDGGPFVFKIDVEIILARLKSEESKEEEK